MSTHKKQFKTESKKMLDMMVNSIYTHKEIFLREIISNASDAIDKRSFASLTDAACGLERESYAIDITCDKSSRILTVTDNGCGMTAEDMESNLGTIAKSGSGEFKEQNEQTEDISVIGQFGVGFYSAFMVADRVTVTSRVYGSEKGSLWQSDGADGYTVEECDRDLVGTTVTLHIKPDTENEKYGEFLEESKLRSLVKKYSDYIRYPIRMEVDSSRKKEDSPEDKPEYETVREVQTLNSMVPIWHKNPKEITDEEYKNFYCSAYYDYEAPIKTVHFHTDGLVSFEALLFIPAKAPYNYYSKDFEKGLQLYSNGVLIMDKCADIIPDYFSFVRGLIDSPDFTLNISRETLQHDHQLKAIAKYIEKKIKDELIKLLENDRENYEKFYSAFGLQLKYGLYSSYGMNKEQLQDLLMYRSSADEKGFATLKEYCARAKEEQKAIYYACAGTAEAAAMLPQAETVVKKGFEVLYLCDDVDEFTLQMLHEYDKKEFKNVSGEDIDLADDEEKKEVEKQNGEYSELLGFLKNSISKVDDVRFTKSLGNHPVCLSNKGEISTEMEKVLDKMPGEDAPLRPKAQTVLEINLDHPVAEALKKSYAENKEKTADYAKILYELSRLICGLPVEDARALSDLTGRAIADAAEK